MQCNSNKEKQAISSQPQAESIGTNKMAGCKKIAMLGTFPPLRGLSSYCLELSMALADHVRVSFISFKHLYPGFLYPGGELKDDTTYPNLTHKNLKVKRKLTWYNPLSWLAEAVATRADLLHIQWWSLPLAPITACIGIIFKLRGKPIVITVHNVLSHERSKPFQIASSLLYRLGDHFIVHSVINRSQMEEHYGISKDRISLVPHGSLDFHVQNKKDTEKIRQEFGFEKDQKVILLFGAVRAYKGVSTALKAFAEVMKKVPQARLLIAGKLWVDWEPYRRLIEDLGIRESVVTDLKYIPSDEVYKYFDAADLLILPYHHFDSQSGVGSMGVSFRKPMIVTDVGGLPDLVRDRRYVVPAKEPEALAQAIINCIDDQAQLEAMAAAAESIAESLGWSSIAKKTYKIYNQVIGAATNTVHV
jgi:glycosyltransferase involved in cell wall biosynthesis